jgi:hypothetical protein
LNTKGISIKEDYLNMMYFEHIFEDSYIEINDFIIGLYYIELKDSSDS